MIMYINIENKGKKAISLFPKNIHNRIRALNYKGAYAYHNDKRIKFFETYFNSNNISNKAPGTFYFRNNQLNVVTGNGILEVKKIQIEGKSIIKISDWKNNSLFKENIFK